MNMNTTVTDSPRRIFINVAIEDENWANRGQASVSIELPAGVSMPKVNLDELIQSAQKAHEQRVAERKAEEEAEKARIAAE